MAQSLQLIREAKQSAPGDDILQRYPALDQRLVKIDSFLRYTPVSAVQSAAEWQGYISKMEKYNDQLKVMVKCQYFEFWSTVVYSDDFMNAVISFLQNSIACYSNARTVLKDEQAWELYSQIQRNVFLIIYRLTVSKESDSECMTETDLGQLIYDKYLFTIPLLCDILITYGIGQNNLPILKRLFERVFNLQQQYKYDLGVMLSYIKENCLHITSADIETHSRTLFALNDFITFNLDHVTIVRNLLEVYPEAVEVVLRLELEQELTQFYDNMMPVFYKNVCMFENNAFTLDLLRRMRVEILQTFKAIVNYHLEEIIRKKPKNIDIVERLLAIYNLALSEHTFVFDYQNKFKIESDIELLRQFCPEMDSFKADFILQAYLSDEKTIANNFKKSSTKSKSRKSDNKSLAETQPGPSKQVTTGADRDYDMEVVHILDLFPHLGDGFIRKLLKRFDSLELVIAAIVEENLPPDMVELDQTEVYIPPDPKNIGYKETGIIRSNIYSGDKCDVLANDELQCTIRYKKTTVGAPKSIQEVLNDKSHVQAVRQRYEEYSITNDGDTYDDEYDDSYDAMAESESKKVRPLNMAKNVVFDDGDSSTDEEEEEEASRRNDEPLQAKVDFCLNPEILRANRDRFRQQKFGAGGGGGGGSGAGNGPSRDVTGNPKGQGQADSTQFNRHKKDQNKSKRANHNRKQGASWKKTRGMIPS